MEGMNHGIKLGNPEGVEAIEVRFIMCMVGELGEEAAIKVLNEIIPYQGIVVGVGMATCQEGGVAPWLFDNAFKLASSCKFKTCAHFWDHGVFDHIHSGINVQGLTRIDHGLSAFDEPGSFEVYNRNKVQFTYCPQSYLSFKQVSSLKELNLQN